MMAWVVIAFSLVGLVAWWLTTRRNSTEEPLRSQDRTQPEEQSTPTAARPVPASPPAPANRSVNSEPREQLLVEAAQAHGPALVCLLCVARADGRLAAGEASEMVDFLRRVGQAELAPQIVARVRSRFTGTREDFEAAIAQIQPDQPYRMATLRAMEFIVERGRLAHPDELALVARAAEVWGIEAPKFFLPVGVPLK